MKYFIYAFIIIYSLFLSCAFLSTDLNFTSGSLQISINEEGVITKFTDKNTGKNYLAGDTSAPLMTVRVQNEMLNPESLSYEKENDILVLTYEYGLIARIKVTTGETHLTFELVSITNHEDVELIVWGPYPTTINKIIGETVGVVRGEQFSIGIQALNPKTLGGYPWNENDCSPQIDIFDQDDYTDLSEKGKRYVLYRVEAAKPEDFGSTLQAYCRNRNNERTIKNWGHEKYNAPPFEDGGVIGSKIAVFGCPVENTLETIGAIEIAEGLPHPVLDLMWTKAAPAAASAYIILDFGERDFEKALEVTKKAGLKYLYHSDPFETWGHFKLKEKQFPNGIEGLKRCVGIAAQQGINIGVHTLSNFITTNDPYVTPVPDKRLAKVGTTVITGDINKTQTKIPIESPDFFNQFENNHLKTVMIGDELIRYGNVSESSPWMLLDCQRGAFGTTRSSHQKGEKISKLADHAYKVFLTNAELGMEVSKNIADIFNETGLRQISFDGLEGNRSTGMGNYGEILFTNNWYDNLNDKIKQHYIADASRTSHFFWHMYTRMNWGEPWYAGFRESQTEYRLKNQPYFKRNLMPAMLGWFKMTPETSIEDIEWMLARSAAFNAGYAFVTSYETIDENRHSDEILKLLGEWEKARIAGAFSDEQKLRMENISNEFHLKSAGEKSWNLYQVHSYKFKHEKKTRQPGEPLASLFNFENPAEGQAMNYILTAVNGDVSNIKMEIDRFKEITLPFTLKEGETAKYYGGDGVTIYNKNWRKLREIEANSSEYTVSRGAHELSFDCTFNGSNEPYVKIEIRFTGTAEQISVR